MEASENATGKDNLTMKTKLNLIAVLVSATLLPAFQCDVNTPEHGEININPGSKSSCTERGKLDCNGACVDSVVECLNFESNADCKERAQNTPPPWFDSCQDVCQDQYGTNCSTTRCSYKDTQGTTIQFAGVVFENELQCRAGANELIIKTCNDPLDPTAGSPFGELRVNDSVFCCCD